MIDFDLVLILRVLEQTQWKISYKNNAVEILGLDRSTLRARMRNLNFQKIIFHPHEAALRYSGDGAAQFENSMQSQAVGYDRLGKYDHYQRAVTFGLVYALWIFLFK